jgi:hypothetical protein
MKTCFGLVVRFRGQTDEEIQVRMPLHRFSATFRLFLTDLFEEQSTIHPCSPIAKLYSHEVRSWILKDTSEAVNRRWHVRVAPMPLLNLVEPDSARKTAKKNGLARSVKLFAATTAYSESTRHFSLSFQCFQWV